MLTSFAIVGSFYRPPAKAILGVLPPNTELTLRAEPENPVDPNAVRVEVSRDELAKLSDAARERLTFDATPYGYDTESILAEPSWHLGYVKATQTGDARARMPESGELSARLTFGANGMAQATLTK